MKKVTFIINIFIILLIPMIFIIEDKIYTKYKTTNDIEEKMISTSILKAVAEEIHTNKEEITTDKDTSNSDNEQIESEIIKSQNEPTQKEIEEVSKTDQNIITEEKKKEQSGVYVGMKITANMVAYGTDCCSSNESLQGITSSGYNIKKSGIYYNDSTYGKVRILASDKNFKLYSIIKVEDQIDGTYYAIVLDRGDSNIGLNKKYLFDVVVETQQKARTEYGTHKNVNFEVMRIGK